MLNDIDSWGWGSEVEMKKAQIARREFIKKAAYVAPVILTLAAAPAYAKSGSDKQPKPKKN